LARYGTAGGQKRWINLIVVELPHQNGGNFTNSSIRLSSALDPPAFNPDLTKSRLNDALCLCEMLRVTYQDAASNKGLGGIVVLGVV
jgi:hypothetical protein